MKSRLDTSVSIRTFRKKDLDEIVRIGVRTLSGPGTEDRWKKYLTKNSYLSPERILVAERSGKILGCTMLLDFRMSLDGKLCPMDGVAAVAVDPLARRQGVADKLMRQAIDDAYRRRVPVSSLYPFRPSFYRRFQYAPVELCKSLFVRPRNLPDSVERLRVRAYKKSDLEGISRSYDRFRKGRTGMLVRDAFWWSERVLREEQERVVYENSRGMIEGYALCQMVKRADLGAHCYRVLELVYNSPRALQGLLGWLSSLGDEIGSIEIRCADDESLIPFLKDPPDAGPQFSLNNLAHAGHIGWGMMLRIIDLDKALVFRPARGARGSLSLRLADPNLSGNEMPRTLRFDGKRARVEKGKRVRGEIRAGIGLFSQIWFGAVSAVFARNTGAIECDAESARILDQAWLGPAPHLGLMNGF